MNSHPSYKYQGPTHFLEYRYSKNNLFQFRVFEKWNISLSFGREGFKLNVWQRYITYKNRMAGLDRFKFIRHWRLRAYEQNTKDGKHLVCLKKEFWQKKLGQVWGISLSFGRQRVTIKDHLHYESHGCAVLLLPAIWDVTTFPRLPVNNAVA